jgi:hypothetical protein
LVAALQRELKAGAGLHTLRIDPVALVDAIAEERRTPG